MTLRQHRGIPGGVEGAEFGPSGTRPERCSVSWNNQSGCPPPALVHVSSTVSDRHLIKILARLFSTSLIFDVECVKRSELPSGFSRWSDHEKAVGALARRLGFTQVSLSSEVMPMVRAVPRGYTVCADAYLTPKIHQYLKGFTSGFKGGLKVWVFCHIYPGIFQIIDMIFVILPPSLGCRCPVYAVRRGSDSHGSILWFSGCFVRSSRGRCWLCNHVL